MDPAGWDVEKVKIEFQAFRMCFLNHCVQILFHFRCVEPYFISHKVYKLPVLEFSLTEKKNDSFYFLSCPLMFLYFLFSILLRKRRWRISGISFCFLHPRYFTLTFFWVLFIDHSMVVPHLLGNKQLSLLFYSTNLLFSCESSMPLILVLCLYV